MTPSTCPSRKQGSTLKIDHSQEAHRTTLSLTKACARPGSCPGPGTETCFDSQKPTCQLTEDPKAGLSRAEAAAACTSLCCTAALSRDRTSHFGTLFWWEDVPNQAEPRGGEYRPIPERVPSHRIAPQKAWHSQGFQSKKHQGYPAETHPSTSCDSLRNQHNVNCLGNPPKFGVLDRYLSVSMGFEPGRQALCPPFPPDFCREDKHWDVITSGWKLNYKHNSVR